MYIDTTCMHYLSYFLHFTKLTESMLTRIIQTYILTAIAPSANSVMSINKNETLQLVESSAIYLLHIMELYERHNWPQDCNVTPKWFKNSKFLTNATKF